MSIDEPDDQLWWMVDDDPPPAARASPTSRAAGGGRRDLAWLVTTSVYVLCDQRGRPITRPLPGRPGSWVTAYSTYGRMWRALRGEIEEHSLLPGETLLARLPPGAGVWLDHGHPDGTAVVLPRATPLD